VHCYRVRHLLHEHIRTCHAQQPPPLEFLFRYTNSGMLFFNEAIYLSNVRAYSYVRRVRAGNLPRFSQSILFMLLLICLFFRFNRTCSRLSSNSYIKIIKSERSCGVTLRFDFPLDLARKVQASLLLYICI